MRREVLSALNERGLVFWGEAGDDVLAVEAGLS